MLRAVSLFFSTPEEKLNHPTSDKLSREINQDKESLKINMKNCLGFFHNICVSVRKTWKGVLNVECLLTRLAVHLCVIYVVAIFFCQYFS